MKQTKKKTEKDSEKSEGITAAEALKKMKDFTERKEKIIASINESEN
jgi:flagellar motility protein MotE (MotC chaperone)